MFDFTQLGIFFLVLARVTGFILTCPLFAQRFFPSLAKAALAVGLAGALYPAAAASAGDLPAGPLGFTLELAEETAVGLGLGVFTGFVFQALRVAGQIIGFQIGFAMAEVVDPTFGAQTSIIAEFLYMLGLVFFFCIDGHHSLILALERSFHFIPPGEAVFSGTAAEVVARGFQGMFVAGLRLAGPVIAVVLITDLALGLLVRLVPQINVFMLGFPLKIMAGIFTLAVTVPFLGGVLTRLFDAMARDLMILIKGLSG